MALVPDDKRVMILDDIRKISKANIKFVDIEPHTFSMTCFEESNPFIKEIKSTYKEIKLKKLLPL